MTYDVISAGEGMNLEFKGALPNESTKWLKTIVAFANGNGGTLVVGVDDNRTIMGVPEDQVFRISDFIVGKVYDECSPQIMVSTSVQHIGGKHLVVVDVSRGVMTPYHIKSLGVDNGTFVRFGATTRLADQGTIRELALQGSRMSFDTVENRDVTVTEESTKAICAGLSAINGAIITDNTLFNSGLLRIVGNTVYATNAYALLMENSPFNFTEVRCAVFSSDNELDFIDRADYSCPLYSQVENAVGFVRRNLRLGGTVKGLCREDVLEIPPEVVREVVVNAVQHRSYADPAKPIYVALYADRLEVTSPGGLPAPMNPELMRQGRTAHRNPAISKIFRAAGISEGWGNGVKTIFDGCREAGLPEPRIENSGIDVRVVIYRGFGPVETASESKNPVREERRVDEARPMSYEDYKDVVLLEIENDPGVTVRELSEITGISARTLDRVISSLKDDGVLLRTGNRRTGQWVVRRSD
ncbi:MAG: putative DNA binding domain-containing protein [Candidatus Methanomethylophilaceae archaeon]|nr:putative DNA binding domain-containing protein [Candidatus Methanomethylophilaceae archaeon]